MEKIENALGQCGAVEGVWVYGSSLESFLVAVAVPSERHLREWWAKAKGSGAGGGADAPAAAAPSSAAAAAASAPAAAAAAAGASSPPGAGPPAQHHHHGHHEVTPEYAAIVASPEAQAYVLGQLKDAAKAAGLLSYEVPKAVHLEPAPFDVERDLITPTFKLKRPNLLAYYKKQAKWGRERRLSGDRARGRKCARGPLPLFTSPHHHHHHPPSLYYIFSRAAGGGDVCRDEQGLRGSSKKGGRRGALIDHTRCGREGTARPSR